MNPTNKASVGERVEQIAEWSLEKDPYYNNCFQIVCGAEVIAGGAKYEAAHQIVFQHNLALSAARQAEKEQ